MTTSTILLLHFEHLAGAWALVHNPITFHTMRRLNAAVVLTPLMTAAAVPRLSGGMDGGLVQAVLHHAMSKRWTVGAPGPLSYQIEIQRKISELISKSRCGGPAATKHIYVKDIARDLADEIMEDVCEQHGGLSGFLRTCTAVTLAVPECVWEGDGRLSVVKINGMDAIRLLRPTSTHSLPIPAAPLASRTPASAAATTSDATAQVAAELSQQPQPRPLQSTRLWVRSSQLKAVPSAGAITPMELCQACRDRLPASAVVYDYLDASPAPAFFDRDALTRPECCSLVCTPPATPPPAEYEAYRLARFLSTETFTPLSALRPPTGTEEHSASSDVESHLTVALMNCWESVTEDPLWIALHYPQMFECDHHQRPTSIRFVLDDATKARHLGSSPKYADKTVDELEALLVQERKALKHSTFKFIKVRKGIRRAIQMKKFPFGSPFLHQDVLAHYIYDLLPEGETLVLDDIRHKLIPAHILERCGTFSDAELRRHPHLFDLAATVGASIKVRRRDEHEDISQCEAPELTTLQLLGLLHEALPKNFIGDRSTSLSTISTRINRLYFKQLQRWWRDVAELEFPHVFRKDPAFPTDLKLFIDLPALEKLIQQLVG